MRAATAADLPAVAALAEATFAPAVIASGRHPEPMGVDLEAALDAGALLVAEDGSIAGYAVVFAESGFLDFVAVRPERRREGIARALLAAGEERARRAGAREMRLITSAAMTESLCLYRDLGYRETERREEGGVSHVFFGKPLPPALARRPPVDGLYGRRRVHGHRVPEAYEDHAIDLAQPFNRGLFGMVRAVRLEVGFGGGEHLLHEARRCPDVGHIGAEPFESGIRGMVATMQAEGIGNVRLFNGDARRILEWLPPGSLDRVDVLYPDPWHKQRHWKRRFISADSLDRLARVLPRGRMVRVASDIPAYVEWTRAHVAAHHAFDLDGDEATPWDGWPGTRYEVKARREGRSSRYLTLRRR